MEDLDLNLSLQTYSHGRELCRKSGANCIDYHYLRPVMRRIGAATTPYSHYSFYTDQLAGALQVPNPRVVISGSADYSWLLDGSPLMKSLGADSQAAEGKNEKTL